LWQNVTARHPAGTAESLVVPVALVPIVATTCCAAGTSATAAALAGGAGALGGLFAEGDNK